MVEEDSPAAPYHCLAITPWIPCNPETWRNVVQVTRDSLRNAQLVLSRLRKGVHRFKFRRVFRIIAQAHVHGDSRRYAPGVLPIESHRVVCKGIMRIADSLHEHLRQTESVRLDRADGGRTGESGVEC